MDSATDAEISRVIHEQFDATVIIIAHRLRVSIYLCRTLMCELINRPSCLAPRSLSWMKDVSYSKAPRWNSSVRPASSSSFAWRRVRKSTGILCLWPTSGTRNAPAWRWRSARSVTYAAESASFSEIYQMYSFWRESRTCHAVDRVLSDLPLDLVHASPNLVRDENDSCGWKGC